MTAALALVAAALFGTGDFVGGLASRRASPRRVTARAQMSGALLALLAAVTVGADHVGAGDVLWGGAAGLAGGLALLAFYSALSRGPMTLVAPLSAVLSALTPVSYGIITGERPNLLLGFGIATALVAIPAVTTAGSRDVQLPIAVALLAVLAGLGFGAFAVCLEHTHESAGLWPIVSARGVSLVLLLAIVSATEGSLAVADRRTRSLAFLAGGFEVAGNVGYLLAIHRGSLAVAGVLVGLYPATTVLCARVVLREHLQRAQLIGLSVAALAVLLITVGATL